MCETDVKCIHKARLHFISQPDDDDYNYTQRYDNTKPNITQHVKKCTALNKVYKHQKHSYDLSARAEKAMNGSDKNLSRLQRIKYWSHRRLGKDVI